MVETVLSRHGLTNVGVWRMGKAGTYPTVIVDNSLVVKLFPEHHYGPLSAAAELEAYRLLEGHVLPVPRLIASGDLYSDAHKWRWLYLVITAAEGIAFSECRLGVDRTSLSNLSEWVGDFLARLHTIAHDHDWSDFSRFLNEQRPGCIDRHRKWGVLPERLIRQVDTWLPDVNELFDSTCQPVFLHSDLHDDHLFGRLSDRHFVPTEVIDFTDRMFGPPAYELPVFTFGGLHGDKDLLPPFITASGIVCDPPQALALTLLHEFNVLEQINIPDDFTTLDQLAAYFFEL